MSGGLGALFDFAARSNRRAIFMLALVSLIVFLPGVFRIPPIDRDEPRFAQATKQMIETGDYVDIRLQHKEHYTRPIGIYWLQAAVVHMAQALGVPDARAIIGLYRLPSVFGAIGAVLATYWCALAFVGRRGAVLAALMMAGSTVLGIEARLARTDTMLLLTIVAAMAVLARAYLFSRGSEIARPGWALVAVFWSACAAGILLKGPVIALVVALTAATLSIADRSAAWLKTLRPFYGIVWLVVLISPWLIAIYARTGNAFFLNSVVHDALGKIADAQESHVGPPGYYVVLFFATFFPGSILAGFAAPAIWARRRETDMRFLLAWVLPAWAVFELAATKLPHYVMPLYPAIAILIAKVVEANALSRPRWLRPSLVWWFLGPVLVSIAALAGAIAIARDLGLPAWPLFAAAVVCGFLAWRLYDEEGAERAVTRATAASALMAVGVYAVIIPALAPQFPSLILTDVLRHSGCAHPVIISAGYEEPSFLFLTGTDTTFTNPINAADLLRGGECRIAFVDSAQEHYFVDEAKAIGLRYERLPRVEAFNFSKGERFTIAVFRSAP